MEHGDCYIPMKERVIVTIDNKTIHASLFFERVETSVERQGQENRRLRLERLLY